VILLDDLGDCWDADPRHGRSCPSQSCAGELAGESSSGLADDDERRFDLSDDLRQPLFPDRIMDDGEKGTYAGRRQRGQRNLTAVSSDDHDPIALAKTSTAEPDSQSSCCFGGLPVGQRRVPVKEERALTVADPGHVKQGAEMSVDHDDLIPNIEGSVRYSTDVQ